MIITAILTMVMIWCLFYGAISNIALMLLCFITGAFLAVVSRHKHEGFLVIDVIAQHSKLNKVNASLKFWTVLVLLFLCVSSDSVVIGLVLTVAMFLLIVPFGGLHFYEYLSLTSLPVSFLLISGLALLFDYGSTAAGVINMPVFQGYLFVSMSSQLRAAIVLSKALGALSCLYLLSLSTPMSEIISVLRKVHIPDIIIELMYLIYRYIFVLFNMYRSMKDAAKSRLGFVNFSVSVKTTGMIYSNLLARSYQKAMRNFDAMESRCYAGEIRFLEQEKKITLMQRTLAISSVIIILVLSVALH
jgi:cobalt/nickel transport system permease protein